MSIVIPPVPASIDYERMAESSPADGPDAPSNDYLPGAEKASETSADDIPNALQQLYSQLQFSEPSLKLQVGRSDNLVNLMVMSVTPAHSGEKPQFMASAMAERMAVELRTAALAASAQRDANDQPGPLLPVMSVPTGRSYVNSGGGPVLTTALTLSAAMSGTLAGAPDIDALPAAFDPKTTLVKPDAATQPMLQSRNANIAEFERVSQVLTAARSDVFEPSPERIVTLPISEIKAVVTSSRPTSSTSPTLPYLQPAPLPVRLDSAAPGVGAYLQVPFNNGSVAGHITVNKATTDPATSGLLPLQITASSLDLNSHLREQLAQSEMPWQLHQEHADDGQSRDAPDAQAEDDESRLPTEKAQSQARLA